MATLIENIVPKITLPDNVYLNNMLWGYSGALRSPFNSLCLFTWYSHAYSAHSAIIGGGAETSV